MNIVFLFEEKGADSNSSLFKSSLGDFFCYAKEKHGLTLFIASISSYQTEENYFSHAFLYEQNTWKLKKNVRPHVVYDKTSYQLSSQNLKRRREIIASRNPFANPLGLSRLLTDKLETYRLFPEFHPVTILIESPSDMKKILNIPSDKVIVKPIDGFGGNNVFVYEKNAVQPIPFPFLAQEFIETATGIPGIFNERHDFRVIINDNGPFYSIIRSPKRGAFVANIHFGGSLAVIPITSIPQPVLDILSIIKERLSPFPKKLYAFDFLFNSHGQPLIVEGNSRPGIVLHPQELPYRQYYYDHILNFLKSL